MSPVIRQVTRIIPSSEWATVLAGLKAPLGVHAVLGNHDWWEDRAVQRAGHGPPTARRALEAAGIPVYENDAKRLSKDGRPFWLAGLGDQLAYYAGAALPAGAAGIGVDDLGATLAKVTDDAPVILMAHEPDIARAYPRAWRCNCPAIPMAARCACSAGRRLSPSARQELAYGHIRQGIATSSSPAASAAASCRSASACRRKSCW